MANTPPSSKKRRFTSNIIKVIVGTGSKSDEFQVHEDYLKKHSPFFQAALDKNWKERQERKIELPEDKPDVVAAYIEWLYSSKIPPSPREPSGDLDLDIANEHRHLAQLYVFGEKIQDNSFCDATIAAILAQVNKHTTLPGPTVVKLIYDGTPQNSPARLVMVHLYQHYAASKWMEEEQAQKILLRCPEFTLDLACAQLPQERFLKDIPADVFDTRKEWLKAK